jgi:hypothetical protein
LSEEDIDKIATAVKQKITVDIESIITANMNLAVMNLFGILVDLLTVDKM